MKFQPKIIAAGLLAILAALPLAAQQAPAAPGAKPSILILGTVHFGGARIRADDRQAGPPRN